MDFLFGMMAALAMVLSLTIAEFLLCSAQEAKEKLARMRADFDLSVSLWTRTYYITRGRLRRALRGKKEDPSFNKNSKEFQVRPESGDMLQEYFLASMEERENPYFSPVVMQRQGIIDRCYLVAEGRPDLNFEREEDMLTFFYPIFSKEDQRLLDLTGPRDLKSRGEVG